MSRQQERRAMPTGQPVLEAHELRKDFPLRQGWGGSRRVVQAVESVSLALVGESGSGKTTVARILACMHAPTRGEVHFEGRPVNIKSARGMKQYLHTVQYVFQDPCSSLNPVHSVRHHLSRPLKLHGYARGAGGMDVRTLLDKVNLTPAHQFLDKYPHQLSGGQPVVLLDVSLRLDVLHLLLTLKEEDGLAFPFITHDIANACYFAEETQVMYAGQVVEGGPSTLVIRQPKHPYTRLLCSAAPDPARAAQEAEQVEAGEEPCVVERGEPPGLVHPPVVCRFHLRCPAAMDVCREHLPARASFGDGHWARCFLSTQEAGASCL